MKERQYNHSSDIKRARSMQNEEGKLLRTD